MREKHLLNISRNRYDSMPDKTNFQPHHDEKMPWIEDYPLAVERSVIAQNDMVFVFDVIETVMRTIIFTPI